MNRNINVFEDDTITSEIVKTCISKLNSGKDDGDIGFTSDHIINGTHRLNVVLSLLFNTMISHGYTPTVLLKSTIVSIPKDNKASLSNSDNYRGISLFNSINKLFDHVILYLYKDQFQSSDMQFGYKKGHSTTLGTLVYKEVISHYVNNNTSVYSCLLDASRAFDRVHLGKLFSILLHKYIPTTVVRLYFDSYFRQKARVGWNNIMSEYFSVTNGVKQGGVLSSMLFSLYIDPLLQKLKQSGVGCHINGNFMGVLSYADDITLICPSIWGLNKMLKICNTFSKNNSILFNKKKTTCIKFGDLIKNGEKLF